MRRKHIIWLLAVAMVVAPLAAVAPSPKVAHADCWSASEGRWYLEGGQSAKAIRQGLRCSGGQWVATGGGYQTAQAPAPPVPQAPVGCQLARVTDSAPFWAGPGQWVEVRRNSEYPNSSWAPWLNCQTGAGYYTEHLSFGGVPLATVPAPAPAPEPWQPAPSDQWEAGLPELHLPHLTPPEIPWEEIKRTAGNAGKVIVFTAIGAFIVLTGAGMAIGGLAFPTAVVTAAKAVLIGSGAVIRLVFRGGAALARLLVAK